MNTAYESESDISAKRMKTGIMSGIIGILLNVMLVIVKLTAAAISGSVSILADAANNFSDAGSSIITITGFYLSGQKPDKKHPFGHGRIEYVSGLMVAFLIFAMAFELLRKSINRILKPETIHFTVYVAVILIFSIAVKLIMFGYNYALGRKIGSPVLINTAKDSISDAVSTGAVLISAIITKLSGIELDGIAGCIVALFIFFQAYEATRDTVSPLLGEAPDREFTEGIRNFVLDYQGVTGVHDIIVHNYGPSRNMVTLHVEVPADGTLLEVHDLIDDIENSIEELFGCQCVIHADPVDMSDENIKRIRSFLEKKMSSSGHQFAFHDLRIIHHKDQKIIAFDVAVPFKYDKSDEELKNMLTEELSEEYPGYSFRITVDKSAEG